VSEESRPDEGPKMVERSETSLWNGSGDVALGVSWALEGAILNFGCWIYSCKIFLLPPR
jgi:hypothetical protein